MIDADTDLAQLQEMIKLLDNWDLNTISMLPDWDEDCEVLQLCFVIENAKREITLSLYDIAQMVYSRVLHDNTFAIYEERVFSGGA